MAQSGYATIQLYYSGTSSNTPIAGNLANGELAINIADGKLFYKDGSSAVQVLATKSAASGLFTGTGTIQVPAGTTASRPTPAQGMFRYNTDLSQFEGYDGANWGGIGGAQAGGAIQVNKSIATVSYTIASGSNGFSVGPVTLASGVTVTVASGQVWLVV
jgi:hypothetical protein